MGAVLTGGSLSGLGGEVEGFDLEGEVVGVEFDYVEDAVAVVAAVEDGVAGGGVEDLFEGEVEIGGEFESEAEVLAQFGEAVEAAVGAVPAADYGVGLEDYVWGVVSEDVVEIVRVPGGDPVFGELAFFGGGGHVSLLEGIEK
jgi:hypothetical protein